MTERHFRVVQLDGKKVEFGGVSITSKASPGSAARKLLTSIAHEKGLKKNKKASMPKVKFCIQEYTQGSSKKVYGPYVGHFHKYTAAELKKAKTAKGKIKFTMKPVVKLAKGKNNMKGGEDYFRRNNGMLDLQKYEVSFDKFLPQGWKNIDFNKFYLILRPNSGGQDFCYQVPKTVPAAEINKLVYDGSKQYFLLRKNTKGELDPCYLDPENKNTCKI